MRYLLTLCLLALAAQASGPDPNRHYQIAARCWLPYEADSTTLGLYHLDGEADGDDLGEIMLDALMEAPEDELAVGQEGNTPDASVYKRNAQATGTSPARNGRFGGGLRFPADEAAQLAIPVTLNGRGWQTTIEGWFHPAEAAAGLIITLNMRSGRHLTVNRAADGRLTLAIGDTPLGTTPAAMPAESWRHLALQVYWSRYRFDHGTSRLIPQEVGVRLLIDGEPILESEEAQHPALATLWQDACDGIRIGGGQATPRFAGIVDEVRVSSTARIFYPWRPPTINTPDTPLDWPYLRSAQDRILLKTYNTP